MTSRFILPFADVGSGITPSSGAMLFFYATDNVTLKDTYSDQLSTPTPNTNPVIADSTGVFGNIYISGDYKVYLYDKNMTQIFGGADVSEVATGDFDTNLINDLSQTYTFATVAAYKASTIEFPVGKRIYLEDRQAYFTVISGTGTATGYKIIASDTVSQSIDLILTYSPNIKEFGAIGGDVTQDSGALNAALAASKDITISPPSTPYIFSNIQLPRGAWVQGQSKYDGGGGTTSTFIGDGTNPVFLCGDGGTTTLREHTLWGLNGDGNTQEVVVGRTAPNLTIKECFFKTDSATKHTIDIELCVRSHVDNNRISNSGGGWAVHWIDNMNGCSLDKNIVTGGATGGAILVSNGNSSSISLNQIETSGKGIRLSCDSGTGHGNSTAITMDNNYIETCPEPFALGLQFSVIGLTAESNYVGNTNLVGGEVACVQWGRVYNSSFERNRLNVNTVEDAFQLWFQQATGDQEGNTIANNTIFGTPANVYTFQGVYAENSSVQRNIGWQNYYDFLGASTRDNVVYESGTIAADVGLPLSAINDLSTQALGGKIIKVEVIEKQGVCTCTLAVGRTNSGVEISNVDPETLTYTTGHATTTLNTETASQRSDEATTVRVTAGVGTGTFRVRITYRVS